MELIQQCDLRDGNGTMRGSSDIEEDIVVCNSVFKQQDMEIAVETTRGAEKRQREDSEESKKDDDGFITVQRKTKRIHKDSSETNETFEVCISSTQILPKQIGMAKLMRSQDIKNIIRIKYKGPYKVLVTFSNELDAEKLLACQKFVELEYRCHYTNQVNVTYGVVKDIDLDMDEKDLLEVFDCESEIISVRRLRRLNAKSEWVPSLSVRIGFKSLTLPSYIVGYGCRFKVEPYTFPVSQCYGCWLYGHIIKFCPTKRIRCPKCGQNHENCEVEDFICINCKGPHMAMNKQCPMFIKEKQIRAIMCENNITYKNALELYRQQKAQQEQQSNELKHTDNMREVSQEVIIANESKSRGKKSYRDVLTESQLINRETISGHMSQDVSETTKSDYEDNNTITKRSYPSTSSKLIRKKKKKKKIYKEQDFDLHDCNESSEEDVCQKEHSNNISEEKITAFRKILKGLKEILLSNKDIGEKIFDAIILVIEEVRTTFSKYLNGKEVFNKILSFVNG